MKNLSQAFRRWLLETAIPATRILGRLHAPWSHKRITSKHYYEMQKILKPGHVLLSFTEGELSSLFIPGAYTHGALALGGGSVIEAIGVGVTKSDLIDFALRKDKIAILEPIFTEDPHVLLEAANWALTQKGKPYDYNFGSGVKAFYCFELVGEAYQSAWEARNIPEVCPWQPRETLGVPTYTANDFLKATSKWKVIWRSEP